ncbi:MAG: phytanoyl-CoA dioxygenase family protein [Pseudomonadota bacterium]
MNAAAAGLAPRRFEAADLAEGREELLQRAFADDGFLIVDRFCSTRTCATLRAEMGELLTKMAAPERLTAFSTSDQGHAAHQYFLDSADRVSLFFEPDALDEGGELRGPLEAALNKVGHALHDLNPVFATFSRDRRLAALCAALGMADPRLLQSMYMFKQPRIGGEVSWHQDSTFLYTDPPSVVGLWFALQPASVSNGCMWALPGSHRLGLKRRFVRGDDGMRFEQLDATPWPLAGEVPLEAPAGTLVVLHGELAHWSAPNTSSRSRHAYAVHVVDGRARYSQRNWLQRKALGPATGFVTE